MIQTERKVIRARVNLLELAKQLGGVTQACRVLGYSWARAFDRLAMTATVGGRRDGLPLEEAMTMEGEYAWEKLHVAVVILAASTGSLRERLEDAYVSSLVRLRAEKHFPWPDIRQSFEDLMQEMAPDGNIQVALSTWGEADLKRIAEAVVGLGYRVSRKTVG